ncbi:MAG: hypothetical protein U1F31_04760 [Steroidobacteraceae bacterium]|jgi:hypothetical protein|nr:hypothetical protein [Steroidobacteraceae bacterium]
MNNRAQILITAVNQTQAALNAVKGGLSGLASAAQSVNAGDEISKMSQRVGISVETLSPWSPLAKQAGVSSEAFEKGLRKFSTTMVDAATGGEDAEHTFKAVGVEFKNQDRTARYAAPMPCCSIWPNASRRCPMARRNRRWQGRSSARPRPS